MRTPAPSRKTKTLLASLLLMVAGTLSACSGITIPSEAAPTTIEDPSQSYRLEPGSRVRVTVFNETNMSGEFTLDPSGSISMPLLGVVRAGNLTSAQLAGLIRTQLLQRGFFQDPNVAVDIMTFRPFYVLGEVKQPGEFTYTTGMTVLSAIARAGGYDYRARQGEVVLSRFATGEQKDYRADERTPVLPGDIIRILQRHF